MTAGPAAPWPSAGRRRREAPRRPPSHASPSVPTAQDDRLVAALARGAARQLAGLIGAMRRDVARRTPVPSICASRDGLVRRRRGDPPRASILMPCCAPRSSRRACSSGMRSSKSTRNSDPFPTSTLSASMVPPMSSTRLLVMDMPSPVPLHLVGRAVLGAGEGVEDGLQRTPASCRSRCPPPRCADALELASECCREPDEAQPDVDRPPGCTSRRSTAGSCRIWLRCVSSPMRRSWRTLSGSPRRTSWPLSRAIGRDDGFRRQPESRPDRTRPRCSVALPLSIFEMSSTSLMRSSRWRPEAMILLGAVAHLRGIVGLLGDDGGEAEHGVHGRADVVGHVGEEGRLRLVGHLGRPKRLGELLGVQRALLLPCPLGPGLLAPVEAVEDDAQAEGRNRDGGHHDQGDVHRLGLALDGLHGHIAHQIGGAVADRPR